MTALTPYSECLERVQSVLVFFAASGRTNGAVLAELEFEVRATVSAARIALLSIDDLERDLDQLAAKTLPEGPASSAARMMRAWIVMASGRMDPGPRSRADGDNATPTDLR